MIIAAVHFEYENHAHTCITFNKMLVTITCYCFSSFGKSIECYSGRSCGCPEERGSIATVFVLGANQVLHQSRQLLLYRFQVQAVSLKMWRRPSCPFLVFGMEYPESLNLFYKFIEIIFGIETRGGSPLIISGVGDDKSPRIIILNTQHLLSTDYKIYIS